MDDRATSGVDLRLELTTGGGGHAALERALREAVRDGRPAPGGRTDPGAGELT